MLFFGERVENGGGGRKSKARSEGADFCPKNGGSFLNVNSPFFFREWTLDSLY